MSYQEEFIQGWGQINYWLPPKEHQKNSDRILALDLDWTLIKPKSNKKFPIDYNDWCFLFSNDKLLKIKQYLDNGFKFVIISNQAIIEKGHPYNHEQFKLRWNHIYQELCKLDIESVYLLYAIKNDFMRKPCIGMYNYLETHLNDDIDILNSKSLYVGYAAGREKDHASTDLKLVLNLDNGLEFKTPENFFLDDISTNNQTEKLIENLNNDKDEYNPWSYIKKLETEKIKLTTSKKSISMREFYSKSNKEMLSRLNEIVNSNEKICILFIGSPSSTKSTFYDDHLKKMILKKQDKWIYTSLDVLKGYTMAKYIKYLGEQFSKGMNCIVDNTNPDSKSREKIISIARREGVIKIISIYFNIDKATVLHLNKLRTKKINSKLLVNKEPVPTVAIHTYCKKYESINTVEEGIDECMEWEFIPNIEEDNLKSDKYKQFVE